MASFLESLGRADIGGKAIRLRESLDRSRANELNKEVTGVNLQKARNELAEQNRVTANRARPMDITIDPTFMNLDPRLQAPFLKQMKEAGVVDDEGRGTRGSIQDHLQDIGTNAELWKSTMGQVVELKKNDLLTLDAEIKKTSQTLTESGKDAREDKNLQTLVQRRDALQKDLQVSDEGFITQLNKLEQIETTAEEARKTAAAKPKTGAGGPAKAQMVDFLLDRGIARTSKEAFRMATRLGTMSREQYMAEMLQTFQKPDSLGITRSQEEINELMVNAASLYDEFVGSELEGDLTGDIQGNKINIGGTSYAFDPVDGTVVIEGKTFQIEGYNPLDVTR